MRKKRHISVRVCAYCGEKFSTKGNRKYCSKECSGRASYKRMTADTICWDCKNATGGGDCPWANKFKPVEGWTATACDDSFIVHKCPLFVEG